MVKLPTADLPWAHPLNPITSATVSGVGQTPLGVVEGTWVVGFFTDGSPAQQPVIIGTLPGVPSNLPTVDSKKGFQDYEFGNYPKYTETDVNRLAVNEKDDDGNTITSAVSVTDTINLTLESHKLDSATGTSRIVAETFSAVPAPGVWTLGINNPTTYNLSFDAAHGLIKDPNTTPTDKCYPLDSPKEYVHQYDLYARSSGAIKAVGGGIPITVASVNIIILILIIQIV